MKGIRKLFLGLVLLTLFGVAFKVETNAAVTGTLTGDGFDDSYNWSSASTNAITATFGFAKPTSVTDPGADFPTATTADVPVYNHNHTITLKQGSTVLASKVLSLKSVKDSSDNYTYAYGIGDTTGEADTNATNAVTPTAGPESASFSLTKAIKSEFNRDGDDVTIDLYLDGTKVTSQTKAIGLYPVSVAKDPTTATATIVVNSTNLDKLLTGESTVIDVTYSTIPSTYRFNEFTSTGMETLPTPTKDGTKVSVTATKSLNTTAASVTASFTSNAGLTFNPDLTTSSVIEPNTSKTVTYTFTGGYQKSDVHSVTLNGTSIGTSTFVDGTTNGNFTFNPGAASSSQKTLEITMKDGNIFTRYFYVTSTSDTLDFDSDPICVTEDQEIYLYSWTNAVTGNELVRALNVMNKAKGKIQIVVGKKNYKNSLPASEYVKNIKIKGVEATTGTKAATGVDGLDMYSGTNHEDTVNVTVYPKPKIEVSSSSGSSSLNSSTSSSSSSEGQIKITMPTKICYDDVENDDTKTAKVKFTTSKGSKEAELTMNKTTGEDGLARHDYINNTALLDILEDLCDSDVSKEVTIKAWPKGDDTVYAEEKITAYRISLDGTAGAKYTVNGKDVSGHFYGLKGAKYTVKASAANGGTLDKTASGDFNSGESFTFEVTGEKTLKAVYNNGASSSSSNRNAINGETGNLDDYDDVPKTGESKTDIWILWSVLFISILGAGFMIWKRFGLVRAIAAADAEVKIAEREERIEKEAKEKEDKLNMLKDLRNL